ncbi:MAG: diaminopimelate dehydrogenase [Nitrospirae bacterium]|nr:diaminopimelate dehydrogenase [Nitrospirota bacterium]MBU6480968.1 diaminopimelate dehydrogenase [Nitrospirota bacterium]MDE3041278.1 diaminopimelate dehydrogenase [Nitrospirota bacterium]MDE3049125.1 diaminopimelate dehydrogenase [Nitrospirota bacterium]MDE3218366.1 diaminopimelate dehydrogenase [Nitrospirota bacterium]
MKPLCLAVVGFGRVGKVCADALLDSKDLVLAAVVRRLDSLAQSLPEAFRKIPVVSHVAQVQTVEGALLCVPMTQVLDAAHECLQHGIPIVESSVLHGEAFQAHRDEMHRLAIRHKVPAIVGAGWDPGALSLFRSLFALLAPEGYTETSHRVGVSLHHTAMARQIAGVKEALCTEQRATNGRRQRYVYVELEQGVGADRVIDAIRADPLFLNDETLVFPVESIAALEQEGRGVLLERRGAPGRLGHQQFLLEARFDESLLTAHMMLAAARALPQLKPGAHSLLDLQLSSLWGEQHKKAEGEWL